MHRTTFAAAFVLVAATAVAAVGCGPKKQPTRVADPNPQPKVETDVNARMSELQQRASELSRVAKQLPGRNAQEDRQLVGAAFEKSSAALQLLGGPEPGGAFRQQLRIIDNTRQQLGTSGSGSAKDTASAPPADPLVDSGLRSLYNALVGVRERLFPNDSKVQQQLDGVRDRLGDLDTVRGPLHALVVAQVFNSTAQVVDTMAGELEGRNAGASNAASAPQ